jgi:tetraacyldisaccharide 4'-kinase
MVNRERVLEIISGQRTGCWSSLIRLLLSALTPVYRLAIAIRNRRFDRAEANQSTLIKSVGVPVISVGNLTTGGTGKTPFVIYVCELIASLGWKAGIVSRGYGARGEQLANDEALELAFRLPAVPHVQSPDRYRAAQTAVSEYGAQVVVLDDGFQHRQLRRDLDIVLIDCTNPFGFNRLLPRGLLREPLSSLRRCQVIVLTRCELVSDQTRQELVAQVSRLNSSALIVLARTVPGAWLQFDGSQHPLNDLFEADAYLFCGIGNSDAFFSNLHRLGIRESGRRCFPDHHAFSDQDLEQIGSTARNCGASAIICTHKDLVKVRNIELNGLPVYSLLIETELLTGQEELLKRVRQKLV